MPVKRLSILLLFLTSLLVVTCIEPYEPPEIKTAEAYLVVNSFLDSEKGDGYVLLTKSIPLDKPNVSPKVAGAKVALEIQDGSSFFFVETSEGVYTISGINLNQRPCRIRIKTAEEKEFLSDYVMPQKTPDIDSVTYEVNEQDGLKISVSTHDPESKAFFFRWRYEQTSQYTSEFNSRYYYDPVRKNVFYRNTDELNIFTCWKKEMSTQVMIASSKKLSEDIVDKFLLVTHPLDSWRYKLRYSILVRQYAMDEVEFNYWNEIEKNTESIGTIFDPQPSMVAGNLHNVTSPGELVLGYFSVSSEKEKRIFIDGKSLPSYYYTSPYDGVCDSKTDTISLADFYKSPNDALIIKGVYTISGDLIGYETTSSKCIDCRILVGGSSLKPDFWN